MGLCIFSKRTTRKMHVKPKMKYIEHVQGNAYLINNTAHLETSSILYVSKNQRQNLIV